MPTAATATQAKKSPDTEPAEQARYITGSEYVDDGAVCERSTPHGVCLLSVQQRAKIIAEINRYVALAATSYQTALQNKRIDLLLQKPRSAPIIASLLIDALTAAFTLGTGVLVAKALTHVAARQLWDGQRFDLIETIAARKKVFDIPITLATGQAKERVKARFVGANPANLNKVLFVNEIQNAVAPTLNHIVEAAFEHGDDLALLMTSNLMNPNYSTVDNFSAHIDGMLERFEAQQLHSIGSFKDGATEAGTCEVVRLDAWGRSRFAVVNFWNGEKLGRMRGDDFVLPKGAQFSNWIDADLQEAAVAVQEANLGTMSIMDVSSGRHSLGPDVEQWARTCRTEGGK